jgi:hypothetical protein
VALLGLLPVFLEWSLQVRTDQLALAGGVWGGAALLASQRRPSLALAAGAALALGWLSSQKLAYVAALVGVLALARLFESGWNPRRELARAAFVGAGASSMWVGFRTLLSSRYELTPGHPARRASGAAAARLGVRPTAARCWDRRRAAAGTRAARLLALFAWVSARAFRSSARHDIAAWGVLATDSPSGSSTPPRSPAFWMTLGLFPAVALALAGSRSGASSCQASPQLTARRGRASVGVWRCRPPSRRCDQLEDTQAVSARASSSLQLRRRGQVGFTRRRSSAARLRRSGAGSRTRSTGLRRPAAPGLRRSLRAHVPQGTHPLHGGIVRLRQFPPELREFWAELPAYRASVYIAGRQLRGPRGREPLRLIVPGPPLDPRRCARGVGSAIA